MVNIITALVFIVENPFSSRDFDRFGIALLREQGFEVFIWDITPVLHPEVSRVVKSDIPEGSSGVRIFKDKASLVAELVQLTSSWFVFSVVGFAPDSRFFFRHLSKSPAKYAVFNLGAIPCPGKKFNFAFWKKICGLTPGRLANYIANRFPVALQGIRGADLAIAGGEKSIAASPLITSGTTRLWVHSLDYDLFLEANAKSASSPSKTCVFLDEYHPFHPDLIRLKILAPMAPELYYPALCALFDRVERELGLAVVIAAHPRSEYEKHPDFFGGRNFIKGNTVELVRNSSLVLLHCSTSSNFSVLFRKPMVFITSNDIKKSFYGPYIDAMAKEFGKIAVNLDEDKCLLETTMLVDEKRYSAYEAKYIKCPGTPKLPLWQVVGKKLRSL